MDFSRTVEPTPFEKVPKYRGKYTYFGPGFEFIRILASDRTTVAFQFAIGLPGLISPTVTIHHDDFAFWSCWLSRYLDEPEWKDSIFTMGIGHKAP